MLQVPASHSVSVFLFAFLAFFRSDNSLTCVTQQAPTRMEQMARRRNRALLMPNLPRHFFPYVFGTTDSGELALMLPMIIPIGLGAIRRTGPSNVANDNFYTRGTFLLGPTALKDTVAHAGAGQEPVPRNMLCIARAWSTTSGFSSHHIAKRHVKA